MKQLKIDNNYCVQEREHVCIYTYDTRSLQHRDAMRGDSTILYSHRQRWSFSFFLKEGIHVISFFLYIFVSRCAVYVEDFLGLIWNRRYDMIKWLKKNGGRGIIHFGAAKCAGLSRQFIGPGVCSLVCCFCT